VTSRRLLGIDYGDQRIGIAVSDGALAVPSTIIEHESRAADLDRVVEAVREQAAAAVVIGLPLLPSGDDSEQTRRCRRFGGTLARRIDVPVVYQDELLTSVDAASSVREMAGVRRRHGQRVDDLAAARILQSYIDEAKARERGS
jgi:putative Holliday junction resolvase